MEQNNNETDRKKKKFVVTDKMVYITVATAFCVLLVLSFFAPRIIGYIMVKTIGSAAPVAVFSGAYNEEMWEEQVNKLQQTIKDSEARLVEEAKASLDKSEDIEAELLEIMPEEIKNMKFANEKEKIEFFIALASEETRSSVYSGTLSFKQKLALQQLIMHYGMGSFYRKIIEEAK